MQSVSNKTENVVCENQEHRLCLYGGKERVLKPGISRTLQCHIVELVAKELSEELKAENCQLCNVT